MQFGVALHERGVVRRESFQIVMPGGRMVGLATQEEFLADSERITQLRQNARIFYRDVLSYFPKSASGDLMRWVALPGDGIVRKPAIVRPSMASRSATSTSSRRHYGGKTGLTGSSSITRRAEQSCRSASSEARGECVGVIQL